MMGSGTVGLFQEIIQPFLLIIYTAFADPKFSYNSNTSHFYPLYNKTL